MSSNEYKIRRIEALEQRIKDLRGKIADLQDSLMERASLETEWRLSSLQDQLRLNLAMYDQANA